MLIPIRCFSCGKPIAQLWEEYNKLIKEGISSNEALNKLGLKRYCCRSIFISNIDVIDDIGLFKKY